MSVASGNHEDFGHFVARWCQLPDEIGSDSVGVIVHYYIASDTWKSYVYDLSE